jgi:sulfoxide reductase heme-binding subunit YedZ
MTTWYLIRGLGFVSLLALTTATTLGALSTRNGTGRDPVGTRLLRQLVHRSVGVLGLTVLVIHIGLAVLDKYVSIPLSAVLLPFGSSYRPVAIGVGVLALYAMITTLVSGALRVPTASSRSASKAWRGVHIAAYLAWGLSMAHGILAGTDTGRLWGAATYAACGMAVFTALALRLSATARRVHDARGHLRLTAGAMS